MIIVVGNLFREGLPAIGHGCNCRGVMGAGIAKQFRNRWSSMYDDYRELCETGSDDLLGTFMTWPTSGRYDPLLVNLFTQVNPGANADLDAIDTSVTGAMNYLAAQGITQLGLPRIGCGIGGLDWVTEVRPLLEEIDDRSDTVELVIVEVKAG